MPLRSGRVTPSARRWPSAVVISLLVHQAVLKEVVDAGAGVVIGDGKAVQALGARFTDEGFGFGHAISRETGMAVEIDEKLHGATIN